MPRPNTAAAVIDDDEDRAYAAAESLRRIVGANLKRARKRPPGKTQLELAVALGVDQYRISEWERGKHLPTPLNLQRLADALGVDTPGWFYIDHGPVE